MPAKPSAPKKTAPEKTAGRKATPVKKRGLNVRQARFAELVASGLSAIQAYPKAGYSKDPKIAHAHASRLVANGGIQAYIAELRAKQTTDMLLARDRKRVVLYKIVMNEENPLTDRLRAIAEDNKMAGHYEPEKVELESGPRTLAAIEERARHVAAVLSIAKGHYRGT